MKNGGYTTWTRAFVPCRVAQNASLPKPKILLCLPLTAAASPSDPTGTTSILVIADEPWYQVGGLAENLVATIEEVTLKESPNDVWMQQLGRDPILSAALPQQPLPTSPTSLAPWVGTPIGTTFDDASTAPLLSNTCFQFQLADSAFPGAKQPGPLDWYMAKLQFQRVISADLAAKPSGMTASDPWASSGMTDGVWVQFLPSSNHFTTSTKKTVDVNNIAFTVDADNQLELTESTLGPVSLQAGPVSGGVHLLLWGLLMQKIWDAAGQPGETYVGLYNFTNPRPVVNATQADTLYLIEVQSTPNPNPQTGTTWLGQLIPSADAREPDTTTEVSYRALRMSAGIKTR